VFLGQDVVELFLVFSWGWGFPLLFLWNLLLLLLQKPFLILLYRIWLILTSLFVISYFLTDFLSS